jgi:hypothetical protein
MITRRNYKEMIEEIGVENLSPTLREYHKDLKEATNDFTDWTDYLEDADIKEATDLYFEEVGKLLSKKATKESPKQESKKVKSKSATTGEKEPRKEKYHIGQNVKLVASGEEGTITNVYVVKSGRFIPGQGGETPKVEYSMTVKTKDSIKTVNEEEIRIVGHSKPESKSQSKKESKESINAKGVEIFGEDVKFIKSFLGLHNKRKNYWSLRSLLNRLQKSIVQKLINKNSPFAKEIRIVQDRLIKLVHATQDTGGADITIEKNLLDKMLPIAGGEKVFASIGYIKRYIGMQGKEIEKEKALSFINQMEKAISKGKVNKADPYLDKVKSIIKSVNEFLTGKEKVVSISRADLNGLMGILSGCGCEMGKIYDTRGKKLRPCKTRKYSDSGKGACSHNKGLSGVMTAEQVANMQFKLLPFTGIYKEIIGQPEKNFTMMVNGEPGAGKTVFLMKFIKFFSDLGSVLYVTSEEFGSTTLTEKVNQYLNPIPSNVHFVSDIKTVNLSDYDLVVFDSINDLGFKLEDFKSLKKSNPETAFILVLQNTKSGQFKGGKEWEHEVQVAGEIENGIISIYKNRYGLKGEWNFFEDEDYRMAA